MGIAASHGAPAIFDDYFGHGANLDLSDETELLTTYVRIKGEHEYGNKLAAWKATFTLSARIQYVRLPKLRFLKISDEEVCKELRRLSGSEVEVVIRSRMPNLNARALTVWKTGIVRSLRNWVGGETQLMEFLRNSIMMRCLPIMVLNVRIIGNYTSDQTKFPPAPEEVGDDTLIDDDNVYGAPPVQRVLPHPKFGQRTPPFVMQPWEDQEIVDVYKQTVVEGDASEFAEGKEEV